MNKRRPGPRARLSPEEVLFEIGRRGALAEGLSDIAAFAVEHAAHLTGAGHAALLQIEGDALLPIATYGWSSSVPARIEAGSVVVAEEQALAENVDPCSWVTADVAIRGQRWAVLAVHKRPLARPPGSVEYQVNVIAQILAFTRELEVANRRLGFVSSHDSLTGLPNRQYFIERVRDAQALADGTTETAVTAVICIDIDRFFGLNDSLGFPAADALLQDVAARLRRSVRAGDIVARQVGDRFLVWAEGLPSEAAALAEAERLRQCVTGAVRVGSREVVVAASAGVARAGSGTSAEELLLQAELAMFEAKDGGRSRVSVFESSFHDRLTMRRHVEIDLREAIEDDELLLQYQPIVDLTDHTMLRAEALVRWLHPDRGLIPPTEFVPIAEEGRLVTALFEWVLNRACTDARAWSDLAAGAGFVGPGVAVNLSARQLGDSGLVQRISSALDHAHLPPESLVVEVNEAVMMSESDRVLSTLRHLHDLGVRLTVDDFGTGYASLKQLQRFPVDAIKIDRPYIEGLGIDPDDTVIVGSIVALARTLGVQVIAEGVETATQAEELARLGCAIAQGYLFARPEAHELICSRVTRDGFGTAEGADRLPSLPD
jgi:diguanylate cyclase (GGDEF)-like protein